MEAIMEYLRTVGVVRKTVEVDPMRDEITAIYDTLIGDYRMAAACIGVVTPVDRREADICLLCVYAKSDGLKPEHTLKLIDYVLDYIEMSYDRKRGSR